MSSNSAERPQITEEHTRFNPRIVAIGAQMSASVIEQIETRFGQPPSEEARQRLSYHGHFILQFTHNGERATSRPITAKIADSGYVVFNEIIVPYEASRNLHNREVDYAKAFGAFPGRILGLTLLYGDDPSAPAHTWKSRLFSAGDTPPIMASDKALDDNELSDIHIETLYSAQRKSKTDSIFHYPSREELKLISEGLVSVQPDLDVYAILSDCASEAYGEWKKAEGDWFRDHADTIRPAWAEGLVQSPSK